MSQRVEIINQVLNCCTLIVAGYCVWNVWSLNSALEKLAAKYQTEMVVRSK